MLTDAAHSFLTERHLATLATVGRDGRVHAVPVGFTVEGDVARVIGTRGTQKFVNAARSGRGALTSVDGARWLALEGSARVRDEPDAVARAVELYARRYRTPSENPARVVLEIRIERVLGSSGMRAEA
jgi:F420H(2)-dependent biliverdin reductase